MAPKPFPFAMGLGVDICRTSRVAALLRHETTRNRWAQRVFTRLEWFSICRRFQRANQTLEHEKPAIESESTVDIWKLPTLSNLSEVFNNDSAFEAAVTDERSKLGVLASFFAGRWAAKEAVIKAHRHRRLYVQDISITGRSGESQQSEKPVALIDPICDTVEMNARVAVSRGLRGFVPRSQELFKGPPVSHYGSDSESRKIVSESFHFNRRRRIDESKRQIAEVSISHDGEYAIAVCMAFDPPGIPAQGKRIVDNGMGNPFHEPEWGDEGWFDGDEALKDKEDRSQSSSKFESSVQ